MVITRDSESLNPGSNPGRPFYFFFALSSVRLGEQWQKTKEKMKGKKIKFTFFQNHSDIFGSEFKRRRKQKKEKNKIANRGFDPRTFGL